jgi:hypothetical protein
MTKINFNNLSPEQGKQLWDRILTDCDIAPRDAVSSIKRQGKPVTINQATQDRVIGRKVRSWMAASGIDLSRSMRRSPGGRRGRSRASRL